MDIQRSMSLSFLTDALGLQICKVIFKLLLGPQRAHCETLTYQSLLVAFLPQACSGQEYLEFPRLLIGQQGPKDRALQLPEKGRSLIKYSGLEKIFIWL